MQHSRPLLGLGLQMPQQNHQYQRDKQPKGVSAVPSAGGAAIVIITCKCQNRNQNSRSATKTNKMNKQRVSIVNLPKRKQGMERPKGEHIASLSADHHYSFLVKERQRHSTPAQGRTATIQRKRSDVIPLWPSC